MRDRNRRTRAPFLLLIAGVLLIAGAVVIGLLQSRSEAPATSSGSTGSQSGLQISTADIPRVNLEEAKAAFDSGEAVFVDVRSVESYAQDHIPGAVSIPLIEVEGRHAELDRDAWIITYCT